MLFPLKALPGPVLTILREAARHVLRRPVVAVAAVPIQADGRIVLIRRGDTGYLRMWERAEARGETLRAGL